MVLNVVNHLTDNPGTVICLVYITSANTWQTLAISWQWILAMSVSSWIHEAECDCLKKQLPRDQVVPVFEKLRRETEGIRKERSWPQMVSRTSIKAYQISPLQPSKPPAVSSHKEKPWSSQQHCTTTAGKSFFKTFIKFSHQRELRCILC